MPDATSTDGRPERPTLAPHLPLTHYYADEQERHQFLHRLFDDTAEDYDRIERLLAFGSGAWYRRQALRRAGLGTGDSVLDVGFGTGLVAREALGLVGPRGSLVGIDPSAGMMRQSHLAGVTLVEGRAESLPRPDASCDFLSLGYALRHVSDVRAAFAEFHRVLRPGGRLLVLEISKPASRLGSSLLRSYMRGVVPLLARTVARRRHTPQLWRYYWDTIEACIPPERVIAALAEAGFTNVRRHVELGMFSEYTGTRTS
ncbi:MAG TPA: class I SAM-dependent methyltransferase [Burkholderiaceae bacterium]|jgi:demethylmenaquinone methyltransferase/2-methoxy-6-polyprenyl-1,4-benzoquinol methylase|nr:class I SAM-dependent methyltransferase [Burkholderiaceae bacterium]